MNWKLNRFLLFLLISFCFLFSCSSKTDKINEENLKINFSHYTNSVRAQKNLAILRVDLELSIIAQKHSDELARGLPMGHFGFNKRLDEASQILDISKMSENEAQSSLIFDNPAHTAMYGGEKVVVDTTFEGNVCNTNQINHLSRGLINSPGHYKNIIDPEVNVIGVGVSKTKKGNEIYFVQIFANEQKEGVQ